MAPWRMRWSPVRRRDCAASRGWKRAASFPVITFFPRRKRIFYAAPATLGPRGRHTSARLRWRPNRWSDAISSAGCTNSTLRLNSSIELREIRWRTPVCRNIRTLFNFDPPVTEAEIRAASLQFVRKLSGFNKPSKANEAAFHAAIDEIAMVSGRLLRSLQTTAPPRDRDAEAVKARTRAAQRFATAR